MTIGEFLKKYRVNKNLSGRKLAEDIGVDKYRLQKWEGGSNPKLEDAEKIKNYFSVDSLLHLTEDILKKCLKTIVIGGLVASIDSTDISQLKDILIEEKEKRITLLEKTIDRLENELAYYQGGEKRNKNS
jgi:transcriptional regulator with XRE-family HTH domain